MDQTTYTWEFFCKSVPYGLREKFEAVIGKGMSLCLVGGASRQWILNHTLPLDLDFEIRPIESKDPEILAQEVSTILTAVYGNVRSMPFHVFIVETMEMGHVFNLEFSLPREEIYSVQTTAQGFGHSDFEVKIDTALTYAQSFARRDFTINAIGVEFRPWSVRGISCSSIMVTVQDPYHGLEDLAAKVLRPVGDAFYYDPVRFLRMIRFQLSLEFVPHASLTQNMNKFNLQKITVHYFLREAFKTDFFNFIQLFFRSTDEYNLELPKFVQTFRGLTFLERASFPTPRSPLDLAIVIAENSESERQKILEKEGNLLEEHLGLKSKTIQKMILAKKSEEIVIKLEQLESSLQHKLSDVEFFSHPLVRDLALVLKGHARYPEIFETRWNFLKKTGNELQVIKQLSQCIANTELPSSYDDKMADRDMRKMMLAMRSLRVFPRIAGL